MTVSVPATALAKVRVTVRPLIAGVPVSDTVVRLPPCGVRLTVKAVFARFDAAPSASLNVTVSVVPFASALATVGGSVSLLLPSTLCPEPPRSAAGWVREALRPCASFSVAPSASLTSSFVAVVLTTTPSSSSSACTTLYRNSSARPRPLLPPPVTRRAVRSVPPTSSRTATAAPAADTSQSTSAAHVTFTRITSPRP